MDITATKVYFPDEKNIKIHQNRVQMCPFNFPAGYHWYGKKRSSPGCPPKWVQQLLARSEDNTSGDNVDGDGRDEGTDADSTDKDIDPDPLDDDTNGVDIVEEPAMPTHIDDVTPAVTNPPIYM